MVNEQSRLLAAQKSMGKERLLLLALKDCAAILRTALAAWQDAWRTARLARAAQAAADEDARHRRDLQEVRQRALLALGGHQSRTLTAAVLRGWRQSVAAEMAQATRAAQAARTTAREDKLRLRGVALLRSHSASNSTRSFFQEWRMVARAGGQARKYIEAHPVRRRARRRTVSTVAWLSWIVATLDAKLAKVTTEWKESMGQEKFWRSREIEVKAQFAEISEAYRRTVEARRTARRSRSASPENSVVPTADSTERLTAGSRIPAIEQKLFKPRTREVVTTELYEAKAAREDLQRTAPPREDVSESAWSWWQSRLALAVERERRALEARNAFSPPLAQHGSASGSRRSFSPKSPSLSPIERSGISAGKSEKHAVVHVYTTPGSPPRVEYGR